LDKRPKAAGPIKDKLGLDAGVASPPARANFFVAQC
jgi:hypothetical protein